MRYNKQCVQNQQFT